MTRRRADTPNPYDGVASHDLSEAQRIEAQAILVERFHGRKDRAAWDRRYWRGRTQVFVRSRMMVGAPLRRCVAVLLLAGWCASCATATSRARLRPSDVIVQLVQFHGAVSQQYATGGMELEHFLTVTAWIGEELRVLQANSKQWEGQARLDWPRVRSICVPFELLEPWARKIDGLLQ